MQLSPFFSYYGGKWRAAKHYPAPQYPLIIEPFAGAAGYATRHADRSVLLCEKNHKLAEIWRYLISATESDIRALPDWTDGPLYGLGVPQGAEWLIGMLSNPGAAHPRSNKPASWAGADYAGSQRMCRWAEPVRARVAAQVHAIKHWRVLEGSYEDCPDVEATWFIDPPYREKGIHYTHSSKSIDYAALADWCRSRRGQVIVCENTGADWLPFRHLCNIKASNVCVSSAEAIWTNEATRASATEQRSTEGSKHMAAVKIGSKTAAPKAQTKPRVSPLAAAVAEAGEAGNQNDLFPEPGDYEPKFLALNERPMNDGSAHQWVEAKFELEDGSEVSQLFCVSGKSRKRSAERLKQLCMALVGVPTVADFNAFDPHGEFIDCLLGFAESFDGTVGDSKQTITPSEYVGTKIRVKIQKGNETADGDWYREPTFKPLEESAE